MAEPCVVNETELEFESAEVTFKAKAKLIVKKGWRDIQEWFFMAKKEETEDSDEEILAETRAVSVHGLILNQALSNLLDLI